MNLTPKQRKEFQKVKSMTNEQFLNYMDKERLKFFALGVYYIKKAMTAHKRVSGPMIEQILQDAIRMRREDGLGVIESVPLEPSKYLLQEEQEKLGQISQDEV